MNRLVGADERPVLEARLLALRRQDEALAAVDAKLAAAILVQRGRLDELRRLRNLAAASKRSIVRLREVRRAVPRVEPLSWEEKALVKHFGIDKGVGV